MVYDKDHTWNNVWGQILCDLHLLHHHHVGYVLMTSLLELVSHTFVYSKDITIMKGTFITLALNFCTETYVLCSTLFSL